MDLALSGGLLFNGFDLDLGVPELRWEGKPVPIQPQPLKVLRFLALHPGEIVSRATLREHLWQNVTFVDFEAGLNFCIRQIRLTLGDDARRPRLVETLRRRGYRFIGPVVRCNPADLRKERERKITVTLGPPVTAQDDQVVAQITEKIAQLLVSSYGNGYEPAPVARPITLGGTQDQDGLTRNHGAKDGHIAHAEIRISRGSLQGPLLATVEVE